MHTSYDCYPLLTFEPSGELGLLSGVNHSRTIVATKYSVVALLSRQSLAEIEKFDLVTIIPA